MDDGMVTKQEMEKEKLRRLSLVERSGTSFYNRGFFM